MDVPNRRIEMVIKLGADDWESVARAFCDLEYQISAGHFRRGGCSGGYDVGFTVVVTEDESISHDDYSVALEEYIAWERQQPKAPQCSD